MNIIILISTPDSRGLVHKISSNLLDFNIEKNDEFVDRESGQFFMRTEISIDSANLSNLQNLNQKDLCEAPENSPASWCKKSEEASSSASADFLLEAEKRGSPPKSEKRQLLARRGSGAGGAALLREKTSEISGNGGTESRLDSVDSAILSQSGLQCRFCESARND